MGIRLRPSGTAGPMSTATCLGSRSTLRRGARGRDQFL
jgi:hypothetical protein